MCSLFISSTLIEFQNVNNDKKCEPSDYELCKLSDFSTIPYISGKVISSQTLHWLSTSLVRQCLSNQYVLMLGDSTMVENVDDLSILLSGIGNDSLKLNEYIQSSTHVHNLFQRYIDHSDVHQDYYSNHRNMFINISSLNISIKFRFTGHYNPTGNGLGIKTFLASEFDDELMCLLGEKYNRYNQRRKMCPKPTILLINSNVHDFHISLIEYENYLYKALNKILSMVRFNETRLFWKGTLVMLPVLEQYYDFRKILDSKTVAIVKLIMERELIATKVLQDLNITYINITQILYDIPRLSSNVLEFTPDFVHVGSIANYRNNKSVGTISMLATQAILYSICSNIKDEFRVYS